MNQLTYLYNTFCQALDSGKEVRAVFCDISKAFDRVWHEGLLLKLKAAGVTGKVLAWFKSYLSDRKRRVILPGFFFFIFQIFNATRHLRHIEAAPEKSGLV